MSAHGAASAALMIALAAGQPALATETSHACEPRDLAALAGWDGVWAAEGIDAAEQGLAGRFGGPTDYKLLGLDAPWNHEGWARMRGMLALAATSTLKQAGWGYPMMMDSFAELKFVISPAETVILSQSRDIRSVYTDGRGHEPEEDRWATIWGDSTGCWEGDTLTIDTVGVRFDPSFNAAAPPLSEQAHFVERLRLTAPGRIENEITITDPATLATPWIVHVAYIPAGIDRLVQDAYQDRNDTAGQTIAPPAEEFAPVPLPPETMLSAAELDRVAGRYEDDTGPAELIVERRDERLYFKVPPFLTVFLPLFADAPLSFTSLDGARFRFITDETGQVTGFEGANPAGEPASGKRAAP